MLDARTPQLALAVPNPSFKKGRGIRMRTMTKMMLTLVMATAFLTGCGGETAQDVAKDMVANMKEMGTILASVTDEASAKAAIPKIDAVRAKMRDCAKRAKAVPKVDAAEEATLNQTMQAGMMEAMGTIASAQERLMGQPELMAIIQPALEGMENDL